MIIKKFIFFLIAIITITLTGIYLFSNNEIVSGNAIDSVLESRKITLNIIGKTGSSNGFFEEARLEFMRRNKDVEINYIGLGTFEAVDYIVNDNDIDAWISADETGADILRSEYAKSHEGKDIISEVSPIATSPLVLVGWEERLKKMVNLDVKTLYDIVSQGRSWGDLGGDPNWGFFNFSHTDPVNSNSGMQFIALMIFDYYNQVGTPKKNLEVHDVAKDEIVEYVKDFEKNTSKQIDGSGKFIDTMIQFGPSKYDVGAIYEYYALANIKNAQGRWGKLKIIYPNPTIWSNRPLIILKGQNVNQRKIDILKKFRDFMLSDEIQQKAMRDGYRPASTAVSDLSSMEMEFSSYGFKRDISSAVTTPSIEVIESIRNLVKRIQ